MRRSIVGLSLVFGLFVLLLCACSFSSEYLLEMQYTNPKTGTSQTIDIPVSQYEYEKTNVGSEYSVVIHTAPLGIPIPVTKGTSTTRLAMLDLMPVIVVCVAGISTYKVFTASNRGELIQFVVAALFAIAFGAYLYTTMQPEFTATGTIIDKTFQIVG